MACLKSGLEVLEDVAGFVAELYAKLPLAPLVDFFGGVCRFQVE